LTWCGVRQEDWSTSRNWWACSKCRKLMHLVQLPISGQLDISKASLKYLIANKT
jgi:hypothetical protein